MDKKKKSVIRAGSVLLVALAAGHLVQTMKAEKTAAAGDRLRAVEQVSAGPEEAGPSTLPEADPVLPVTASLTGPTPAADPAVPAAASPVPEAGAAPEPASVPVKTDPAVKPPPPADEPVLAALPDAAAPALPVQDAAPAGPATLPSDNPAAAPAAADCTPDLTLAAGPMATIAVTVTAPCRAGERIVLRHAGLAVAERLSDTGTLAIDLPALQSSGEVSVLFPDAEILSGSHPVPDLAQVRRFGVQWMAADAFQLFAFENGTTYGDPGAIWSGASVSDNGGYLIALGDPLLDLPMLAEVYTFPADAAIPTEIAIEAAVTDRTCGRDLLGETLHLQDGALTVTDLTLAMPDCDALGDILVLINPDQNVTLAAAD